MNGEANKIDDIGGEMNSRAQATTMPFRRNRKNEWHIAALFLLYLCEKGELEEKVKSKNYIRKLYYSEFKIEFFQVTPKMNSREFPSFCLILIMFLEKRLIMRMVGFESNVLQFHPQNVKTFLKTYQKCVIKKEKDKNEPPTNDIQSNGNPKKNKKRSQVLIDQRFAFQLLEKFGNQIDRIKDNVKNHCRTCNENFPSENELISHFNQESHQIIYKYQHKREELVSFHYMLQISLTNSQGIKNTCMKEELLFPNRKDKTEKHIVIYLSGKDTIQGSLNLTLINVHTSPIALNNILKNDECFKITGFKEQNKSDAVYINPINLPVVLSRGSSVRVSLKISTSSVGRNEYFVFFKFMKENKCVHIMQKLCVLIESEFTAFESSPSKENVEYKKCTENVFKISSAKVERVRGSRKKRSGLDGSKNKARIKDHVIPHGLISILNHALRPFPRMTKDESKLREQICDMIKVGLGMDNYVNYFSLLLFIEQHQMTVDILKYSLEDTPLFQSSNPSFLALDVPGLAEKRPSVLRGDSIMINTKDIPDVEFEGKVQKIENTKVLLKFCPKFMERFIPNMKVNVRFDFSRRPHNLQHEALEMLKNKGLLPYICFPTQFDIFPCTNSKISWISRLVENNERQREAVINILNGSSRPAPYLLFGPPGTGKTMTVVEAILQILQKNVNANVLVAAPSNAAVDVISSRLVRTMPVSQIIRVYSPSREWFQVPEALQNCCNYKKEKDSFDIPDMATLIKYKVVAVTMITAGRLIDSQLPENHFSHIFIDECAQGLEPESLISVAALMKSVLPGKKPPTTQLVLSGDPLQLGPVLRSPIAKKLGLEKSLLERLMTTVEIYQRDENTNEYNPKLLTKLVKNFRSHPVILDLPNKLFYQGELQASGDVGITHCACKWELLPKKNYPIIFHGVDGKEERDNISPSYFNTSEIHQVVKYLREILSSKFSGTKISPSEIGIISPYRRQVERIRNSLEKNGFGNQVSVASVEEFQGQERRVIIISTVRSDPQKISLDRVFRLGFLKEPKRFNVAITRAKALLIIIGNPNVLQSDPCWGELLKYCYKLGCYTGIRFSFAQKESDEEDDDDEDDDDDEEFLPYRNGNNQRDKNIGWNVDSVIDKFEKLSVKANDLSVVQKMIEPPWESHE